MYMNNSNPISVSNEEFREILDVTEVREGWGLSDDDGPELARNIIYAAKFDFVSGFPGYVGDVFVLLGDSLESPVVLIRDETGALQSISRS